MTKAARPWKQIRRHNGSMTTRLKRFAIQRIIFFALWAQASATRCRDGRA